MLNPAQPSEQRLTGCDAFAGETFAACEAELPVSALQQIEEHLQECAACRTRFMADAVFLRAVRRATAIESAPQSLRDRVSLLLNARAATENAPA